MTREEELYEQSKIYLHDAMQNDDFGASGDLDEIKEAFKSGARWADSHPLTPWKSINEELPNDNKYKLILSTLIDDDDICYSCAYYDDFACEWYNYNGAIVYGITHWMSIPELSNKN